MKGSIENDTYMRIRTDLVRIIELKLINNRIKTRNCMSQIKICIVHVYEKAGKSIPILDKGGFTGVY